jgi:hypothetical protein
MDSQVATSEEMRIECECKQMADKLRSIATGDKLSEASQEAIVQDVIANSHTTPQSCGVRTVGIKSDSLLGVALQDRDRTAYFSEAEFRVVKSNSDHRFLATSGILNCICVFVRSVDGTSFGAHLNLPSLYYSLEEIKFVRKDGVVFQNMCDKLQELFSGVDVSKISISLVGGWTNADFGSKLKQDYYKSQEKMWSFSDIIITRLQGALPGVAIDASRLNYFEGISWEDRNPYTKLKCIVAGEAYRVAVLDIDTGVVHVQVTDLSDLTGDTTDGVVVPSHALLSSMKGLTAMHYRIANFRNALYSNVIPASILTEYTDVGVNGI